MIEEELHLVSAPFYFMTAFRVLAVYFSLLSRGKKRISPLVEFVTFLESLTFGKKDFFSYPCSV